jgi:hypothetical protein
VCGWPRPRGHGRPAWGAGHASARRRGWVQAEAERRGWRRGGAAPGRGGGGGGAAPTRAEAERRRCAVEVEAERRRRGRRRRRSGTGAGGAERAPAPTGTGSIGGRWGGIGVRVFGFYWAFGCWAGGLLGSNALMGCSLVVRLTEEPNRRTGEFRFQRIRNRTRTDFLGSGSFGSGSRFFRFGSRFSVFRAQAYSSQHTDDD